MIVLLALVSGLSFFVYGYQTLFGEPPRGEFERYGMPQVRVFVGLMQLLGGIGVLAGLRYPLFGAAAASGLALMMLLGLMVRYRVHDAPRLMVPAASFALVNASLVWLFLDQCAAAQRSGYCL